MHNSLRWAGVLGLLTLLIACQPASSGGANKSAADTPVLHAFLEPEHSYGPILEVIQSAKKTIRVEMFVLNDRDVIQALKDARKRGVDVRVIVESDPPGVGTGNKPAIAELQANDIQVKAGNPAYPLTHTRAIAVDDRIALIMTLDQTHSAFTGNREYGIIDADKDDVAEINSVFDADWNQTAKQSANPDLIWGPESSRQRITALIDAATKSLDIEAGEMQDDQIMERLIAAVRRGVVVRLIMSPSQSGPDANIVGRDKLKRGGVTLRMLKVPFIHATMIVADKTRGFVGSQDFTPASLDSNRELGILVQEPTVVGGLGGTFLNDWEVAR